MSKEYSFTEVAVGSDAEGFFVNKEGRAVPVVGLLGGTKGTPIECDGGGYLEDCVAWEINPEPVPLSEGADKFADNIIKCLDTVKSKALALDLSVDIKPAHLFKKVDLRSPQASVSGCSTSYCAWDLKVHDPIDLGLTSYRFASGDLHVSWPDIDDDKDPFFRINMVRMLDIFIGMSEIVNTEPTERSKFYGIPGVHRPTPYGVEYKTPSNFWLRDRDTMKWAYNTVIDTYNLLKSKQYRDRHDKPMEDNWKDSIKTIRRDWNKANAQDYLYHFKVAKFPQG